MERPRLPDYETENNFEWQYVFELNRYIEHLERQIEVIKLGATLDDEAVLCGCIDKCMSKRNTYYCRAIRPCVNKIGKNVTN